MPKSPGCAATETVCGSIKSVVENDSVPLVVRLVSDALSVAAPEPESPAPIVMAGGVLGTTEPVIVTVSGPDAPEYPPALYPIAFNVIVSLNAPVLAVLKV